MQLRRLQLRARWVYNAPQGRVNSRTALVDKQSKQLVARLMVPTSLEVWNELVEMVTHGAGVDHIGLKFSKGDVRVHRRLGPFIGVGARVVAVPRIGPARHLPLALALALALALTLPLPSRLLPLFLQLGHLHLGELVSTALGRVLSWRV